MSVFNAFNIVLLGSAKTRSGEADLRSHLEAVFRIRENDRGRLPAGGIVFVGHNSASYDDVLLHAELQRIKASNDDLSDKPILSADTLVAAIAARKAGKLPLTVTLNNMYFHGQTNDILLTRRR